MSLPSSFLPWPKPGFFADLNRSNDESQRPEFDLATFRALRKNLCISMNILYSSREDTNAAIENTTDPD